MPSTRQRQSRLSFTPLPSSSPATKAYNKQIQDRAAAVTIRGSPSKKRKLRDSSDEIAQMDGVNDSMPTPAATLERNGNRITGTGLPPDEDEDSDDVPLVPTQRSKPHKRRKTARQQRLDFSNPRDADSFDSPVKLSSSAQPQSSTRAGMFGSGNKRTTVISSDEESEEELPSPAKMTEKKKGRKLKRSKKAKAKETRQTRSTRRSSQIEPESEEDEVVASSQRQLPLEVESDDEEDEMPNTMATQRRKRARKEASPDSFISSSPPIGPINDSDDDLEIIEQPSKRRKRSRDGADVDDEDEDEDEDAEPITPGRRKLKRPQRKFNQQEADDLAEDLDFLGPSSDAENEARKPRNTQTTQKEARQSALEKLKRKRSSQPAPLQPIVVDYEEDEQEDEHQDSGSDNNDDDDEVEEAQPLPMSSRQYFTANEQDEDFIESEGEAGDGILGAPDSNMPIEFTQYARMKPKELFVYAVEWMVQKKINPAFSMDDEIYGLTFRKLDDEVKGLAGSKFTSSAWTEEFTFALRARPDIAYEPLDRSGEHYLNDHCDACNRSGHPATFQIQFQGKPYHLENLEEVNNDADDDSDSDDGSDGHTNSSDEDNKPCWDAQGREIVPATRTFYVGKFCMGNAKTAHALQHWKYHLNAWVVVWLTSNGYLRAEKIVERDSWSERKRRKHANKIADRMEKMGVVKKLWKEFSGNISEARDSKQGRW